MCIRDRGFVWWEWVGLIHGLKLEVAWHDFERVVRMIGVGRRLREDLAVSSCS